MNRLALILSAAVLTLLAACGTAPQRSETLLEKGWRFHLGEAEGASAAVYDDSSWEEVRVPHDWAIYGPFDKMNDLQNVAVTQNFEREASLKTGRTGGLPYVGVGWYRCHVNLDSAVEYAELLFDGAMSEARVYVNGREVGYWPYGYNAFHCDITDAAVEGDNVIAVRLENLPQSSRWYPGAGLFRNVHLITAAADRIPTWGVHVTTPEIDSERAVVNIETEIEHGSDCSLLLVTRILDADGDIVAESTAEAADAVVAQSLIVESPALWSPETPNLYKAVSSLYRDGRLRDQTETVFGIRSIEISQTEGFLLNGEVRKFKGVCNHHDLGPLGAAVNEAAIRHRLKMLKDMGCDAIRTSHNMPSPELVRLCNETGFMMMLEPFDEWDIAKCENGYHRHFDEWAERDMVNMLRHYRNDPAVVMWSIGNEVPSQCDAGGASVAAMLQSICHREDPTRPVTCGMDQVACVLENGFAEIMDVVGLNYRTFRYEEAFTRLPQHLVLGSETSSTVSSRGVYKFPAEKRFGAVYDDHQCSSYDLEACWWSNIPDIDLALNDDYYWTLGQFVWTGFDYLGEPSPYDTDAWPNHSSMFGIIDLASIPKDRYWLYRSVWNKDSHTLHILPHWNWEGHEGENIPVFVYTDFNEAELFLNGRSLGRRVKQTPEKPCDGLQTADVEDRYRLRWMEVPYEAGELRVVAYDADGEVAMESCVRTAGEPYAVECTADRTVLTADGKDLAYVTVSIVDKDGNLCPRAAEQLDFKVEGVARFRAAANGDPTCLEMFHEPRMHTFNGRLTVIVGSGERSGKSVLTVSGEGLQSAETEIVCK